MLMKNKSSGQSGRAPSPKPRHLLHRLAIAGEQLVDRLRPQRDPTKPIGIEPYIGWSDDEELFIRGRVLVSNERARPVAGQSLWMNIRQMAALFLTDEIADTPVSSGDVTVRTDEEGYFLLRRRKAAVRPGWNTVPVEIAGRTETRINAPVWVAPSEARFLVISDIDDTILKTGAYSLVKNLWTTLTGNALTRRVYADAPPFLDMLHGQGCNPVFYVSSSPWNLHAFLLDIFERNGIQRGPLFLRDLGISHDQFIKGSHGSHKGSAIDTILAANPELPAVLVGDTGQHDAEVYFEASERWPGRIRAVVLRNAVKDSEQSRHGTGKLKAAGMPVYLTEDFMTIAAAVERDVSPIPGSPKKRVG